MVYTAARAPKVDVLTQSSKLLEEDKSSNSGGGTAQAQMATSLTDDTSAGQVTDSTYLLLSEEPTERHYEYGMLGPCIHQRLPLSAPNERKLQYNLTKHINIMRVKMRELES